MKSRTNLKLGLVASKSNSLGQIIKKNFVYALRCHILSPILMKLSPNVCLYEISDRCENGSCQVTTSNLRKILCMFLDRIENGSYQIKN